MILYTCMYQLGIVAFDTLHVHVPTVELFLYVTATPSTQQAGGKSRTNMRAQTDGQANRQTDRQTDRQIEMSRAACSTVVCSVCIGASSKGLFFRQSWLNYCSFVSDATVLLK